MSRSWHLDTRLSDQFSVNLRHWSDTRHCMHPSILDTESAAAIAFQSVSIVDTQYLTIIGVIRYSGNGGNAVSLRHLPWVSEGTQLITLWAVSVGSGYKGSGHRTLSIWRSSEEWGQRMRAEILQASGPGPGHIWTHSGHISPQSIIGIIFYLFMELKKEIIDKTYNVYICSVYNIHCISLPSSSSLKYLMDFHH